MRRSLHLGVITIALSPLTIAAQQVATSEANGATLRALDKLSGRSTDIQLSRGSAQQFGKLQIALNACRFPAGNPAGDAFASLTILEAGQRSPVFEGWMISSAPALSAMDHQRYDVWVIRCTNS